ncbi:MAG: hypothetical protein DLM68_11630 [Hyphomicrobiales bacterium]|nr:MAG: hypothetical protein DLM68_11630 [Hyphomicrobiales bacterium]
MIESQLGLSDRFAAQFKKRYAKVSEDEKRFTLLFISTYLLGSVMIGTDFMLKHRREPNLTRHSPGSNAVTKGVKRAGDQRI